LCLWYYSFRKHWLLKCLSKKEREYLFSNFHATTFFELQYYSRTSGENRDFDAVAVSITPNVPKDVRKNYLNTENDHCDNSQSTIWCICGHQSLSLRFKSYPVMNLSYKTIEASINCQKRNSNQNRKGLCYRVLRAVLSATFLSQAARDTCFVNAIFCWQVRACNQKVSILKVLGQNHDALHQLHLSLECLPGHVLLFQFLDWHLSSPYW